jgi:hypothetical protein
MQLLCLPRRIPASQPPFPALLAASRPHTAERLSIPVPLVSLAFATHRPGGQRSYLGELTYGTITCVTDSPSEKALLERWAPISSRGENERRPRRLEAADHP